MRVEAITITDLRSIEEVHLELGAITLLVGRNNTGKSTIIAGLHAMQESGDLSLSDTRIGSSSGPRLYYELSAVEPVVFGLPGYARAIRASLELSSGPNPTTLRLPSDALVCNRLRAIEPVNYIYPYLSSRKVTHFEEAIDQQRSLEVRNNSQ